MYENAVLCMMPAAPARTSIEYVRLLVKEARQFVGPWRDSREP